MRLPWLPVASLFLVVFGRPSEASEPIALKLLYAGNPDSDREHDFTTFLGKSFAKVGTADYRTFKEDDAKGNDVVILDWTSIYPRDKQGKIEKTSRGLDSPNAPKLSSTFDRPTILIGAAGGFATMQSQLKIDWL
ncbi:MAG TPA: hypothetical protein VKA15_06525 [Isosphaeraceae bacterium]|nr:hypothetical protein [Isosphaeraceae bacterium]